MDNAEHKLRIDLRAARERLGFAARILEVVSGNEPCSSCELVSAFAAATAVFDSLERVEATLANEGTSNAFDGALTRYLDAAHHSVAALVVQLQSTVVAHAVASSAREVDEGSVVRFSTRFVRGRLEALHHAASEALTGAPIVAAAAAKLHGDLLKLDVTVPRSRSAAK